MKNQASKNQRDMTGQSDSKLGFLLQVRPGEGRLVTLLEARAPQGVDGA